jgi:hypothetical protein
LSRVKSLVAELREHLEALRPEASAPVFELPEPVVDAVEELLAA